MSSLNITHHRLANQHIIGSKFKKPEDLVAYMGAVQAQDYAHAKWAIGVRMPNVTDAIVDKAIADGKIIRTHVLRPTWHFVSPADVRWMLQLTAPRIKGFTSSYRRRAGLTNEIIKRSNKALTKALKGGKQLIRTEVLSVLKKAGIPTDEYRFIHLMMHAELDGIVCNGVKQGKQFTYALLDERVPPGKNLKRDEALAELAKRYFTSHGPATFHDFAWWSGLSVADAKIGLEMIKQQLLHEVIDGKTFWFPEGVRISKSILRSIYLLPAFDEFTISYRDRSAAVDSKYIVQTRNGIFNPIIVIGGKVEGTWKRTVHKNTVKVETNLFKSLTKSQDKIIISETKRFADFLGLELEYAISPFSIR